MRDLVKIETRVVSVTSKEKVVKHEKTKETPAYYEAVKIGRLTLEFDADHVDIQALNEFVGIEGVALGLAETQMGLGGGFNGR